MSKYTVLVNIEKNKVTKEEKRTETLFATKWEAENVSTYLNENYYYNNDKEKNYYYTIEARYSSFFTLPKKELVGKKVS